MRNDATDQEERQRRASCGANRFAVIICGSRHWDDRATIAAFVRRLPAGTLILHGDCPSGADRLADEECRAIGLPVWPMAFFYEKGRKGGPLRNAAMLRVLLSLRDSGYRCGVAAFPLGGPGTRDMTQRADRAGVPVEICGGSCGK